MRLDRQRQALERVAAFEHRDEPSARMLPRDADRDAGELGEILVVSVKRPSGSPARESNPAEIITAARAVAAFIISNELAACWRNRRRLSLSSAAVTPRG